MSTTESDKQRVIKFRAWIKSEEVMVTEDDYYDYSMVSNGNGFGIVHDDNWLKPEEYVIMQFTGLLDKNGNEIYEGDNCQYGKDGLEGKIWWNEDTARWKWGDYNLTKPQAKKISVIGHIYSLPSVTTKEDKE